MRLSKAYLQHLEDEGPLERSPFDPEPQAYWDSVAAARDYVHDPDDMHRPGHDAHTNARREGA